MENQVTSIEQSQRLLELGVPAEKASLVWTTVDDNETVVERDLCLPENIEGYAFTVADLLGMLPAEIDIDYFGKCFLCINKHKCHPDTWHLYYKDDQGYSFFECTSERGIILVLYATVAQLGEMGYLTE